VGTPLMYAFREREKILDLFESLSGSRMMCDYMRFGGCRSMRAPIGWRGARRLSMRFPKFLDEFEKLIVETRSDRAHAGGRQTLRRAGDQCGITGPMLRACGVNYDIRKVDGYGFYPSSSSGCR
jgi:NADH-quinone oxidoreductase subunit D